MRNAGYAGMTHDMMTTNSWLPRQVGQWTGVAGGAEHIVTARAKFPDDGLKKRDMRSVVEVDPDFGLHRFAVRAGNVAGRTDALNVRAHVARDFPLRGVPETVRVFLAD